MIHEPWPHAVYKYVYGNGRMFCITFFIDLVHLDCQRGIPMIVFKKVSNFSPSLLSVEITNFVLRINNPVNVVYNVCVYILVNKYNSYEK